MSEEKGNELQTTITITTDKHYLTMHDLGNVHSSPTEEGPTGEEWWGLVAAKRFFFCPDRTSQDDELVITNFGKQATFFFPCLSG